MLNPPPLLSDIHQALAGKRLVANQNQKLSGPLKRSQLTKEQFLHLCGSLLVYCLAAWSGWLVRAAQSLKEPFVFRKPHQRYRSENSNMFLLPRDESAAA